MVSCIGVYCYGNRSKLGPVFGLASQVFWFGLAYQDHLWGLFVCNTIYTVIHIRNLIKWRRKC